MSDLARFMDRVHEEPNSGCWLWAGGIKGGGYGAFHFAQKQWGAHRWAAKCIGGLDVAGKFVCHSCDNKLCVNPAHLWTGSAKDNTADMIRKGRKRTPTGENHGCAKLTAEQVEAIRLATAPQAELSQKYGVSVPQISRIRSRKTWRND